MHTYQDGDWRFHHNGGFDGDIIIAKNKIEVRTTSKSVLEILDSLRTSTQTEAVFTNLIVPRNVLEGFVADRCVRRKLEEWLENASDQELLKLINDPRVK